MEDHYGSHCYSDSHECWDDYVKATLVYYGPDLMPFDYLEAQKLGHQMISYYFDTWLKGREDHPTYIHNGVPQTEVNFKIRIPVLKDLLDHLGLVAVYYQGTIDRILIDSYTNLWIDEYKSAARIETKHFLTDPQVTSYCWAAQHLFGVPVVGCCYKQWRKAIPDSPRVLQNGTISVNKQQATTHRFYREALIKVYGEVTRAPKVNVDFLNELAATETADDDGYIRRDWITRSAQSLEAEGAKILMEVQEMLDPDLPLYPNPTRECMHMCDFRDACISLDDGSDWEEILQTDFMRREEKRGKDPWRQALKHQIPVKEMQLDLQNLYQLQTPLPQRSLQHNPFQQ